MDKHQAHKQRYPGGIPRSASAWHSVGLASMRNGTQFASRRSIVQPCLFCGLCVRTIRRLPRSDHLPRSSEALALLEAKFIYLLEKLRHHAFEQLGEHHRRTRGPSLCGTSVGVIPPSCGAISPPIDEMRGVCHHTGWKPLDVASQNLETDSCLAPLLLRRPHAAPLECLHSKVQKLGLMRHPLVSLPLAVPLFAARVLNNRGQALGECHRGSCQIVLAAWNVQRTRWQNA